MSRVEQLHDQAMDLAEKAFAAQRKGKEAEAINLFLEALELELQVASEFPPDEHSEPTRSILYRSAASMAFHANEYNLAEQLIARGLSGYPPAEIKDELRALQEDITFSQHISLKGTQLAKNKMLMTLDGDAVGYGVIALDLLVKRLEQLKTIFYRTVERLSKLPYRTTGPPSKEIADSYNIYFEGFVPGSARVALSITEPTQLPLFPDHVPQRPESEKIIGEVLTCFELLQENELDALRERFENKDYLQNFVGIVRQMAPDGADIKVLGLASWSNGEERTVGLRRLRREIPSPNKLIEDVRDFVVEERETFHLEGVLKLADSLKTDGEYGIVKLLNQQTGKPIQIWVPLTQMQDVVQPYFEEYVLITGFKENRKYFLEDIDFASPSSNKDKDLDNQVPHESNRPGLFD